LFTGVVLGLFEDAKENETINLKYKTIIFPTVSNPIFRDTYLYIDVFPKCKNLTPIEKN